MHLAGVEVSRSERQKLGFGVLGFRPTTPPKKVDQEPQLSSNIVIVCGLYLMCFLLHDLVQGVVDLVGLVVASS